MKKEDKGKKNFNLKTVGKGTTLAAMVAALGISLGTEIKNVYAQGNDLNSSSKLKLEGSLALKLETGGSQEIKLTNQIISGRKRVDAFEAARLHRIEGLDGIHTLDAF